MARSLGDLERFLFSPRWRPVWALPCCRAGCCCGGGQGRTLLHNGALWTDQTNPILASKLSSPSFSELESLLAAGLHPRQPLTGLPLALPSVLTGQPQPGPSPALESPATREQPGLRGGGGPEDLGWKLRKFN